MDRNITVKHGSFNPTIVALRKESVDRNFDAMQVVIVIMVALRKESVDRNLFSLPGAGSLIMVALRKESVDRNTRRCVMSVVFLLSLSARRAWIEISLLQCQVKKYSGRSPQGERG